MIIYFDAQAADDAYDTEPETSTETTQSVATARSETGENLRSIFVYLS
jgi:hypothetical protein